MKKLIHTLIFTIATASISTSASAQETIETINPSDLQELQQLACTGNSNSPELQASLGELESTIMQTLAAYGMELTDEQLESAYAQATATQNQLEAENTLQQFCADY